MVTVKVIRPHSLAIEDAKTRSSDVFRAYASKYGTRHCWNGDRLVLSGDGIDVRCDVTATSIDIQVTLGAAASALMSSIEADLRSDLQRNFD